MKARQVGIVLFAIIVLGAAGALAALTTSEEEEEQVLTDLTTLAEEVIDKVVLVGPVSEVTLEKVDNQWFVGTYPVSARALDELWETAGEFDGAELIATKPINHPGMGVAPQNGTLAEFWSGGQLHEKFVVGDSTYSPIGAKIYAPWTESVRTCYLRREDRNEVYGVFCPTPDRFFPHRSAWIDPIILDMRRSEMESVIFSYPNETFELREVGPSEFQISSGLWAEPASLSASVNVRFALSELSATAYATEAEIALLKGRQPDAFITLNVTPDSTVRSTTLLFYSIGDGSFYVQDAEKLYPYVLDPPAAAKILITRQGFQPRP